LAGRRGEATVSTVAIPSPGFPLSLRQALLLVALTVVWGLNWPVMKAGIAGFPPLSFRTLSMWLGLPVLYAATRALKVPLRVERRHWRELGTLTFTNMIVWYVLAMLSLQALSSGRAAILGYTMPIFSAVIGMALFGQRLGPRQWVGVGAAALGVALLLWHELGTMAGRPWGALGMLLAAAVWALGTQQLRRTRIEVPTMALVFWMTLVTTVVMTLLSVGLERGRWTALPPASWFGVVYNAVLIIGFGQPIWLVLARSLPPIASTLSVMLIPVLGTASGAWWLSEQLHWQDFAAMLLMLAAIASVLWPARPAAQGWPRKK
jgi:drug/metabolite transporter (DMT)-like permease